MSLTKDVQNMFWLTSPAAIYAVTMLWRGLSAAEIARRLGLAAGRPRDYLAASAVLVPVAAVSMAIAARTVHMRGSMIAPFSGASPSLENVAVAFSYGLIATGFPEELLFRGLIAGSCFRRFSFWRANLLQAALFMLPHLLLLLVAPTLWPVAICVPLALGLCAGWLRHRSGSIGPAVLVHAGGNVAGALSVMDWMASR